MAFPLRKLVSWLLPAGGEGGVARLLPAGEWVGCMLSPHWGKGWGVVLSFGGQGYLFVKLIPVFVCCCVKFPWLILVCPVFVVFHFYFICICISICSRCLFLLIHF